MPWLAVKNKHGTSIVEATIMYATSFKLDCHYAGLRFGCLRVLLAVCRLGHQQRKFVRLPWARFAS